ncbi:2TM domain-containing protein [Polaribacter sp. R77954]|uniref:2TM domain-containing protein n=1 Tax=Polaribacter sp. R77954 TaxID=3093870 RepID=UPI0037CBB091
MTIINKMQSNYIKYQMRLKATQKVKDIKGFYTHCIASFLILPFLVFINLQTVPQFHWFWYAIMAWCIGLIIHWINVFAFSKMDFKKEWKDKKVQEIFLGDRKEVKSEQESKFIQEQYYLKAKKATEEIKGFYIHLIVHVLSFPLIVFVNLNFVPSFHFFWFALGGMLISLFFHWLGVFGFEFLGLGENWEERKINKFINSNTI